MTMSSEDKLSQGQKKEQIHETCMGVISSPYIACAAICKTALDNPTIASSHKMETVKGCTYMDDLLLSMDTLD